MTLLYGPYMLSGTALSITRCFMPAYTRSPVVRHE